MLNFVGQLFETNCLPQSARLRGPGLVVFHAVSDSLIALAYFVIPLTLLFVVRRRRDLRFPWIFAFFALFILSCGITYLLDVVDLWMPVYLLQGIAKGVTALFSVTAAVLLFLMIPTLTRLPSAKRLQNQIEEGKRAEREVREMNRSLELRVTERTEELQRANQRLVESELRMRHILDSAGTLVYVKDLEGRYTFVNAAFVEICGYTCDEILGRRDEELFEADLARVYRENDQRALSEGGLEFEEVGHSSGRERIYLSNKFPLKDLDGRPHAVCGVSTDITDRKLADESVRRANQELRASEERLRQITELVPDMLWSANVDTTRRFISQSYLAYTGYTPEQFEHGGFLTLFHPDDAPEVARTFRQAIETGAIAELEVRIRRYDGVYRWFISRTVPICNENFQVEYLIGAVTDINDLKRTEQALRRSNEELEQFAYAAAHDLQEPLRNISTSLGMFQRVAGDRLSADEADWIERSIANGIRMQAMVKDLLLYSRVVSEDELPGAPVSAGAAAQEAITNLNGLAGETGAHIRRVPLPHVRVQEQHLVLLFQNLIGNALKYRAPERTPEISISAEWDGSEWEFSITDNGIGFDNIYAERIFKVFKRLHNRDEYAGNGIGLAICARIVAHYGGRIWAEGTPGQGATFRFTLPSHQK